MESIYTNAAVNSRGKMLAHYSRRANLRTASMMMAILVTVAVFSTSLAAPAGLLDTSFGNNGIVRIDLLPEYSEGGPALAIQDDGKVVAAGTIDRATNDFLVVRYNEDGSLDTSFSGDGWLITDLNSGSGDVAQAVLWMKDSLTGTGKILVGGWSGSELALARYCPHGSLDDGANCGTSGFGIGGVTLINLPSSSQERIYEMAAQPDGKIVVVGTARSQNNPVNYDFMAARLLANGALDPTFGVGGVFRLDLLPEDGLLAVAIEENGNIVVGGYYEGYPATGPTELGADTDSANFITLRLTPSGALDSTFGSGLGYVTHDFGVGPASVLSLAVQKDGKILAGGFWRNPVEGQHALVRYCPDGRLDSGGAMPNCGSAGFGVAGAVITGSATYSDEIRTVLIQADGRIVAGGLSNPNGNSREMGVNRYMAEDGSLDPTFGVGGMTFTRITDGPDQGIGMVINPQNGLITLSGEAKDPTPDNTFDFVLTRYYAHTTVVNTVSPGQSINFSGTSLTIGMDSGPSGGCTFTVSKYPIPAGGGAVGASETPMYWNISSTCAPGSYSLTMTFNYTDVELLYSGASVIESELLALHSSDGGSSWINQGGSINTAANRLVVSNVTGPGMWWLASGTPSTTTIGIFETTVAAPQVILNWTTLWEGDLKHFDVYRSRQSGEHGEKINPTPLLAKNSSGPGGASYTFTDPAGLPGQSYYWLKLTLIDDSVRWFGPDAARIDYSIASNFQAAVVDSQVNLSWSTVWEGELKQFDLYRSRSAGDHGDQINPTAILPVNVNGAAYTFTDPAGLPGLSYYWLKATLLDNSVIWFGPDDANIDYPITSGFQAAVEGLQVNLTWSTVWEADLKQFDVYRSRLSSEYGDQINPGAILPQNLNGAGYSFLDSTEQHGQLYYWLKATLQDNSVVWFGPSGARIEYDIATNFQASAAESQVDLSWNTVWEGELKQFDIFRSRNSSAHGSQINTAAILPKVLDGATYTYADEGELFGLSYYWLRATLQNNSVIWFGPLGVRIDYEFATNFQAEVSKMQVDLTWDTIWDGEIKQFDIFRSRQENQHGVQVNYSAILPKNPTSQGGSNYNFTDGIGLIGQSYYWLRVTLLDNSVVWFGPRPVTVVGYQILLPFLIR